MSSTRTRGAKLGTLSRLRERKGVRVCVTVFLLLSGAGAARAEKVAVLQGLDKITARVSVFDAPIGQSVAFGTLMITARACEKHPPEEPPETAAFLQIDEAKHGEGGAAPKRLFSGWMFASSPALSALENPIYDVIVLDCREGQGEGKGASAAPPPQRR
ncbi:MAG TPA: DUF2155 domain-containing protein [Stellaceae bacterium]|nr:DUF2155 domain-containing protein [Stellaceae bacterium]